MIETIVQTTPPPILLEAQGFEKGVELGLSYIGNLAYIPPLLLLLYALVDRLPKRIKERVLWKGNEKFSPLILEVMLKEILIITAFIVSSWLAIQVLTEGSLLTLSVK